MSIYATLWKLQFPEHGDDHIGCGWVEIMAQGVPPHIGSSTPGFGYEDGDPYGEFLPPPLVTNEEGEHELMRAVIIVKKGTRKGTNRSHQEYVDPLLVLTGEEYARLSFEVLHERICQALRGGRPRLSLQCLSPSGRSTLVTRTERRGRRMWRNGGHLLIG
ncbi:MAG TPA: hypothetical protein VN493_28505 [Thermoanaerobaculia bacterium]|nr:hypothetical protein [Thermoanaerobaculia bacterium]